MVTHPCTPPTCNILAWWSQICLCSCQLHYSLSNQTCLAWQGVGVIAHQTGTRASNIHLHIYCEQKGPTHVAFYTSFFQWAEIKDSRNVLCAQKPYFSNFVQKLVYIPVGEHFYFAEIIHPPDSCGISRSGLNGMSITQVHLCWGQQKAIKCAVLSHNTMP